MKVVQPDRVRFGLEAKTLSTQVSTKHCKQPPHILKVEVPRLMASMIDLHACSGLAVLSHVCCLKSASKACTASDGRALAGRLFLASHHHHERPYCLIAPAP